MMKIQRGRPFSERHRGPLVLWIVIVLGTMTTIPALGEEVQVLVESNFFSPADVVIDEGDSVRWINQGGFHNVDADDGSFGSGDPSSALWELVVVFDNEGENPYHCDVHGGEGGVGMSGTVTVILFGDGFESGTTDDWSSVVSPAEP